MELIFQLLKEWLYEILGFKNCLLWNEALCLLIPIYGGNFEQIGWKSINHNIGIPRPIKLMDKNMIYDVCVVGSGAGAGPIIYELSRAGLKVCVLEKEIFTTKRFFKRWNSSCKDVPLTPNLKEKYHTVEEFVDGSWHKFPLMKLVGVLEWFTFRWFFKFYEWIFS